MQVTFHGESPESVDPWQVASTSVPSALAGLRRHLREDSCMVLETFPSHRRKAHRRAQAPATMAAQSGHREAISPGKPEKRPIKNAAKLAGLGEGIGWHTFRHTYRSWLNETGAPMKVQQELMRHASIQTTMNAYGRAMAETKCCATVRLLDWCSAPTRRAQKRSSLLRPTMDRHSRSPSEILHHPSIAVLGIVQHGKKANGSVIERNARHLTARNLAQSDKRKKLMCMPLQY